MSTILAPTVELIEKAWSEYVEMENRRSPKIVRNHFYASSRRKCLRRAVLEATEPGSFPEFETDAKARFARGIQRERDISIDLMRVGRVAQPSFEFIGQQERIEIFDRRHRLVIAGKIDGYIKWASGEKWPTEIKSWSPFLTDRLFVFEDLFLNKWAWSGAHQLLSYLYAKNQPNGLLVLDRPGLPRLIRVNLEEHLQAMEDFIAESTLGVDHIAAGTLPDFIQDVSECRSCPAYGHLCNPPTFNAGAQVIVDEETIEMVERYAAIQEQGEEYKHLDKKVKEKFRGTDMAIVGSCLVEGKWQRDTKYNIPDDVKTEIEKMKEPFAKKVEKGKFFLTVTKV